MRLLAIDPGPKESAFVVIEDELPIQFGLLPTHFAKMQNSELIQRVYDDLCIADHLVIEKIESFGMAVGAEVFETVFWSGRFVQAWQMEWTPVTRKEVKMHLCGSMRAKDANIRQAIIDKFGGPAAVGKKKSPGPLYGISGDCWSALAVGLTWLDTQKIGAVNNG